MLCYPKQITFFIFCIFVFDTAVKCSQVVVASEVAVQQAVKPHNEQSFTAAPIVQLAEGKVRGIVQHWDAISQKNDKKTHQSVHLYEGIPYGRIPGRFEASIPVGSWSGVYEATQYGSACPQLPSARMFGRILSLLSMTNSTSELACLVLNVWRPAEQLTTAKPRAVMVFIHGGAFETGTIFTQAYDGRYLASTGDVIVVTVQYRLAAFGFLTAPGLVSANLGLRDQILALQWIRRNIASFGGDPSKVTIFGESAGGSSVAALVLSPLASGLFSRAIVQSAAQGGYYSSESVERGLEKTMHLAGKLGCYSKPIKAKDAKKLLPGIVQCLKKQPMEAILAASKDAFATNSLFLPVYGADSEVLPIKPEEVLNGKSDSVHLPNEDLDLMFGITKDEGSMFALALFPELAAKNSKTSLTINFTQTLIVRLMQHYGRSVVEGTSVAEFYVNRLLKIQPDPSQNELKSTIGAVWGDLHLACPTMLFGQRYAERARDLLKSKATAIHKKGITKQGQPKHSFFAYQLNTPVTIPKMSMPPWIGTFHTTDLFYLFMTPLMRSTSEGHYRLSLDMMTAWANFAKSGSPGRVGETNWEEAFASSKSSNKGKTAVPSDSVSALVLEAGRYHMQKDTLRDVCQRFWKGKIDV